MRGVKHSFIGLLCLGFLAACATPDDTKPVGSEALDGTGGFGVGSGGQSSGTGGESVGTGGESAGTGSTSGTFGSGGSMANGGSTSGAGGAGCLLGICPAGGASGTGGAQSMPDAGSSHKAMCNQKLCIDPVFDCILQGCGDAVCQIPFCVIK